MSVIVRVTSRDDISDLIEIDTVSHPRRRVVICNPRWMSIPWNGLLRALNKGREYCYEHESDYYIGVTEGHLKIDRYLSGSHGCELALSCEFTEAESVEALTEIIRLTS